MKTVIIYITNIDPVSMDKALTKRLDKITQQPRENFPYDVLSRLCWCLGSISGCMSENDESKFIVSVIKELLNLTERTSGKANKAQVATNIMYVVSRFPRFLCGHWAFLKTVIKKLNEFMHEKHPGVQDMASQTFLTISELTKQMFVQIQRSESRPYIYELIDQIPDNMRDLSNNHRVMVYHGMGHMVSAASTE